MVMRVRLAPRSSWMSLAMRERSRSTACSRSSFSSRRRIRRRVSNQTMPPASVTVTSPPSNTEPPRLPEMRQHVERQRDAGFVPHAVVVARDDVENIIAGRRQNCSSPRAWRRLHPVCFQIFNAVFELHFFRRDKAQGGVMKFKTVAGPAEFSAARDAFVTRWSSTSTSSKAIGGGSG